MKPNTASANSPRERMRTKKTPMIALKRVKTLPATMLETEREDVSGGEPSLRRRLAASALLRPRSAVSCGSVVVAALEPIGGHSIGFPVDVAQTRLESWLLGHWSRW